MPPLAFWLSSIGYQCFANWIVIGPDGMRPGETAECFATLVLAGLPLSFALILTLRRVAWLNPGPVTFAGSLAVAGITSTAFMLFRQLDATAMILLFNAGAALLALLVGYVCKYFATRQAGTVA